ncbi:SDR family NAD(P)-dependent oxidoreductase [Pelistega europaea]|uniref:SDR family NAD(P)-dependent oxidoreductase n=1 Tax=Pelistega europaea TaxID=106147 RepID=UPI001FE69D5C|nr:SDR family NAD(P)-dependent oxidoreductase [Pelistega europaea]
MQFNFQNKNVVITGATGGIGKACAQLFAEAGASLILCDRDIKTLQTLETELKNIRLDLSVRCFALDVSSYEAIDYFVEQIRNYYKEVDYVIPCAGIYPVDPIQSLTKERWDSVIAINLTGVFYLIQGLVPLLSEHSAIVNLSSMAAHRGAFYNSHYSASKGGIISLTKSLARELGPRTRVNVVSPGIIATKMIDNIPDDRQNQSKADSMLKRLGKAEEVASVIAFLCSDAASFITAENIHVNGGLYVA